MLVNNFFIRCCLKNLTHQANPRSPSAFSASNQIPIGHVLTELLKIFLPERGEFLQMSVILFVVVSRDSPPCGLELSDNKTESDKAYEGKRKRGFIDSCLIDSRGLNIYSLEVKYKFKVHNNINITQIFKVRKVKIIAKYRYNANRQNVGDYLFIYCYTGIVCI